MDRQDFGPSITNVPLHPLHEGVRPIDILRGRNFLCQVRPLTNHGQLKKVQAWKMSPFGIEIIEEGLAFSSGEKLELEIQVDGSIQKRFATAISFYTDGTKRLVCLRFTKRLDGTEDHRQRSTVRWTCDPFYSPTVQASLDGGIQALIYFRAMEMSLFGMGLMTSARNRGLLPGVTLTSQLTFPLGVQIEVGLLVKYVRWVEDTARPFLSVGVEVVRGASDYRLHAGQYLLEFGSSDGSAPSPKALRVAGFTTRAQGSRLELAYVRSAEEFKEILQLRALSFGQNEEGRRWEKWSDKHDAHSRILVGRFRGKIVCSGRVVYQDGVDSLEQSKFLKMPDLIPRDAPLTEIGRVCTHPDYRGDDLLVQLFRFIVLTMMESGQRYMIVNCTDELLGMYETVGLRKTGASFIHPNDGARHYLIFSDLHRTIFGVNIHPLKWMLMIGAIWDQLAPYVPTESSVVERVKLRLLLAARPALRLMVDMVRKRGQGKKPHAKIHPTEGKNRETGTTS